jgi:hypothetical protein
MSGGVTSPEPKARAAARTAHPKDDADKIARAIALLAQSIEGSVAALGLRLTAIESALSRLAEIHEARLEPEQRASLKLTGLRSSVASLKTSVEHAQSFTPRR